MSFITKIQDKLSSNKNHSEEGVDSSQHTSGGLTGQGSHLQQQTGTTSSHPTTGTTATSNNPLSSNPPTHGSSGITGGTHPSVTGENTIGGNTHNAGLNSNTHTTGSGLTGGSAHTHSHHQGGAQSQNSVDFVPGSHPNANNHSAIPTAGGQKVGGVNEGYSGTDAGVHQTVGDKVKNALPGQHGNAHDAHGNPIHASSTGAHTTSSHPTDTSTTSGLTTSNHGHSNVGGLSGSSRHDNDLNTTHNTQPGTGFSSSSSSQPLSHDSKFNDRHSGPGVGTGLATGTVGGAGLASAGQHHNQDGVNSTTHGSHQQHGTGVLGEDNRGMMDKAKDTLSSKRSNQPDDPITGTNYDQKNRDQYTQGTNASGPIGSSHGNYAQTSSTHQSGVAGITKGVNQTHLDSNTNSKGLGHSHGVSHEGRSAEWKEGYAAGYKEATLSLGSHSSSTGAHSTGTPSGSHIGSTGTHSSTTGTGYTDTTTKPSMMNKLNPKTDADRDGKTGIMD